MQGVSFHDLAAGTIAGIIVLTIAILAIIQAPIPTPLETALGFSLGWLFRGATATSGLIKEPVTPPGG